jgi:hypothetical protein
MFCKRKGCDHFKKPVCPRKDYPKETDGPWFWLFDEAADQGCRRLDKRQRRLNSELLRAVEEGAVETVVR